jgi:hypothetical protein
MPRSDFDIFAKAENAERVPHIKDQVLPLVNRGLVDLVELEQDLPPGVAAVLAAGAYARAGEYYG